MKFLFEVSIKWYCFQFWYHRYNLFIFGNDGNIYIYISHVKKIYIYIYNENNIQYILEIQWLKERKKEKRIIVK